MPRPNRIELPEAWYIIHNKSESDKYIFHDEDDYQTFYDLVAETSQIFDLEVHGYCLLEDEYYLLIHTKQPNLSRAMRHLNGIYTQKYNQVWENDGHVFRSRYKSLLIQPDYLADALAYIHSRPVEAGATRKAVNYKHSSHQGYIRPRHKLPWLETETVLKPLGFIKTFALAKLNKMVQLGPSETFMELIEKERSIIGSVIFKEQIEAQLKSMVKTSKKAEKTKLKNTAKEILDFVSYAYKIPVEDIKTSHSGIQNEARNMAVYQLRTVGGLPQKEIAHVLNAPNGYTVAKTLQRFNSKIQEDYELAEKALTLTESIQERLGA